MAQQTSQLPCDGDGICMLCKKKPIEEETLTCKTCVTPWHANCLSTPPETLAATLQWECPDCSPVTVDTMLVTADQAAGVSDGLVAKVHAIQTDESLTEQEKAKRCQELVSGRACSTDDDDDEKSNKKSDDKNDILKLLGKNMKCSLCTGLLERPVTAPCGHNFCLQCFQKWTRQGNRKCTICRVVFPPTMASQPRINSTLVTAIRVAKLSRNNTAGSSAKVYHCVQNDNRPDKAYTTDRAKKAGKANACSGKIFVTVPSDHFGPIPAENDPCRNQGVRVGESWEDRMECRQWGAHFPHVAGIAGQSEYGAQSVALSGGYQDDEDHGEWFLYTGSGGRDLSGNKRTNKDQSSDQMFVKMNEALRVSCRKGYPVRVVRSHKEKRSAYAPETGVRYDGVYRIEKCWRKNGIQGFMVCRYLFVRCDNEPAPWTSDEHGDRPRPLPVIKELNKAVDIFERREVASWDYDDDQGCWKWKQSPPVSRKPVATANPEDMMMVRRKIRQTQNTSAMEKLMKGFGCPICRGVLNLVLSTPCGHNFCKPCLEGVFAGQAFVKERTCLGGRTLRSRKNIMKCPSCPTDISDFLLQSPQINRELMNVIESLQHTIKENAEKMMSEDEIDGTEDTIVKSSESSEVLADGEMDVQKSPAETKPKRRKTDGLDISSDPDGGVGMSGNSAAAEKPEHHMTGVTVTEAPESEILIDGKTSAATDDDDENIAADQLKKPEPANGEKEVVAAAAAAAVDEGNDSPSSPLHVRSDDDDDFV